MAMPGPKPRPIEERFWPKVEKSDGCWLWTGAIDRGGYGILSSRFGQPPLRAPRVSWEIHHGPIPEGMWVLHRCDVRRCVRPDHLFLGTQQDNVADMAAKGRAKFARRNVGAANGRYIDGRRMRA